ncbi:hypothetical protein [Agromyces sp. SYSU T00194]|uniref:hypothetical protein n=1 Tax=Agromyces chitinivorans TaxID=3158560 RepID=UPI0033937319
MDRHAAGVREDANRRAGWAVLAGGVLLCGSAIVLGPTLVGGAGAHDPPPDAEIAPVGIFTSGGSEPEQAAGAEDGTDVSLMCCREHYSYSTGTTTIECVPITEAFLASD